MGIFEGNIIDMDYPQLFLTPEIKQIIKTEDFGKPIEPKRVFEPKYENNMGLKIIFLIVGIGLVYFKIYYGYLLVISCIYWLIKNPERNSYDEKLRQYYKDKQNYDKENQHYTTDLHTYNTDIINYNTSIRQSYVSKLLKVRASYSCEIDYRKGLSHNFFKFYLIQEFGEKIFENIAIKKYNPYKDYKPYITDFSYIDSDICIDIEIDEPYSLKDQKGIHLNDIDRNNFFLTNGWLIIRFSEEQVVRYPYACCKYIKEVIEILQSDCTKIFNITTELPITKKWDSASVKLLITSKYRDTYMHNINSNEHNWAIKRMEMLELAKMFARFNSSENN